MYRAISLDEHLAGAKFNLVAAEDARSLVHYLTVSLVSSLRVPSREA
jgi:hypothetical protein